MVTENVSVVTPGAAVNTPRTQVEEAAHATAVGAPPRIQDKAPRFWDWQHSLGASAIVIAIVVFGRLASPLHSWIACIVLLTAFLVVAGQGTTGVLGGALIDQRNKMSLSRLQMII